MKSKKSQKSEVLELLPKKIKLELNLILQNTTQIGILKRLPNIFIEISKGNLLKTSINQFKEESDKRNEEFNKDSAESISWLENKLALLKTSRWAEHPAVKYKIQRTEDALSFKYYNPFAYPVDHILDQLKEAAFAVASFGPDQLFDTWAKIGIYSFEQLRVETLSFIPENENDSEKWKFSSEIGYGYICWKYSLSQDYICLNPTCAPKSRVNIAELGK